MPVTQSKDISYHGHYCSSVGICKTTGVPKVNVIDIYNIQGLS